MQFYFAWVDETDTTFTLAMQRADEQITALDIKQAEGAFASAEITIKNPKTGLLNAGRHRWAWIAFDDGATVTPLFYGRLVGIPQRLTDETVQIAFIAKPVDFQAQKETLAAALRVLPFWDPVWIVPDRRDDPDSVLEARTADWHIDRTSLVVTVSDWITGEDGTIDLAGDFIYDSLDVSYGAPPLRTVSLEAKAYWTQAATGSIDITARIAAAAKAANSGSNYYVKTLTGYGLIDDWPAAGDNIGRGWSVYSSNPKRADGKVFPQDYVESVAADYSVLAFPVWNIRPTTRVEYDAERRYSEILTFTLQADVQALLTDPAGEDESIITLSTQDVDQPVDAPDTAHPDGALPIGDLRNRSFFQSDRGRDSVEYLIALARSRLLYRARAVQVSFRTTWQNGLSFSCRKNCRLADGRLPGGAATGKITAYRLHASAGGSPFQFFAEATIDCAIGQGSTVTETAGTPVYAAPGYAQPGWQAYTGKTIVPIAGEVAYTDYSDIGPADDGIDFYDFRAADAVEAITITDGFQTQRSLLQNYLVNSANRFADLQAAMDALDNIPTKICVTMVPLDNGPFETDFPLTVSTLAVPKTIDLEAV